MATFNQFDPPICHGHLTSHNVMLELQPGTKHYLVKIADLELKLKLAKSERKALIEQLILKGQVDLLTDKITAVFRRLK